MGLIGTVFSPLPLMTAWAVTAFRPSNSRMVSTAPMANPPAA